MLQKCANPACATPFRSLREGKLFLAESGAAENRTSSRRATRRREHFWLCGDCSGYLTLQFDTRAGMLAIPIRRHPDRAMADRGADKKGCA